MSRLIGLGVLGVIVLAVVIQVVPFGRDHANPPVAAEPKWDSPQTRALALRACFDCHSNETVWPWYSDVAPMSWLIQHDVEEGRQRLNFSAMDRPQREARGASREVQRGSMPPFYYLTLHPAAAFSTSEKEALIQGLQATLGATSPGEGGSRDRAGGD